MNKIYKVIWSKVKHQYVVVSELAHSNGKQSRTAKRSLRSRIAALVVCGAIAAFGVFGTQNVMAAEPEGGLATIDQYVAYKYNQGDGNQSGYEKVFVRDKNSTNPGDGQYYWVRNGYTVEGEYVQKQDGTGTTFVISKVYAPNGNISDVLVTSDVTIDGTGVVTNSGEELNSVELGNYAAVSNGGKGGAEANTECHYIIETENGWENVGVGTDKFDEYFKTVDNDSENGLKYDNEKGVYTYNGEVVSSDNIYYIKDGDTVNAGVFVVNDEVYKSTVYGNTKEILTTVKDDGSLKTFWSTEAESSDIYLKDSNIKVSDLNTAFDTIEANEKRLENNDIREITVTPNENKIGLVRNSDKEVDGSIYVSSVVGENGNAQVKFAQKGEDGQETSSFVVDAGSIVKANEETTANDETLTSLSVDGTNYKLSQGKTYDDGAGISISQDDTNTISVNTGNGLKIENDQVVANVDGTTVKTNGQGQLTATTLDKTASAAGKETIDNGYNYKVVDTAGNEVEITDVASASKLGEVAENAAKHTTAYGADDNISVKNKATDGKALNYEVKLNPNLKVDSVTAGGENGTVINSTGLSVGGNTYVTSSGLNANNQKITNVADGDDDSDAVNFGQLKEYTSGTSKTDYQLVTNPNSEDGKYTVNDKGEVTLTVQDMNKENGETKQVTLSDIASATDVGNLTTTVEAGWTATAADNNGTVKVDKEHDYTLAFNGDNNITVTAENQAINVGLNPVVTLDDGVENGNNVKLSGTNGTISAHNSKFIFDGTGNYDNANDMTFDQNGLTVTNTQTMKENDETTTSSTVINGGSITTGNVTAGGITVNADNGGTVNGLTNKTWDAENYISGQAATEDQLKEAVDDIEENDYDGWKVSANGVENGVDVTTGSTVDFSNTDGNIVVGQDGTNLTFDLAKDITLDDGVENGNNVKLSGTNGTISAHNSEFKFGGTGNYDNANDMTFDQNGLTVTNTQTMRDTGETTTSSTVINGGSIATGNITAGGITVNADNGGTVNGLTNKTWDADNYVSGQAATEDQLQEAAAASKTTVSNGTNTTVTSVTDPTDGHVDYQVNLNDNVYLGGNRTAQNSNIKLDGEKGNIQVGSNIALLGEDGRAIIGGVDISTTFDDIGKKSATITGLSNTTWDADKVVIDRAATEGQLQMVSDKVTAGWTATDDNGNKINVNPDNHPTLNFASGKNITVSAVNDEVEVSLNDNINLNDRVYINGKPAEGNNTIVDIKSGDTSKEESIFAVEDKGNGSISIGGIDVTNVDGPYLAVGDGKLKFYKDGGLATGNETGTFSVRPDGDLEINGKNSSFNVDAETGNVNAINNSGSAIMMNDDSVALNASGNGVAISDEGILLNTNSNGTSVSIDNRGTTFTNTNTGETTNINGDIITTDTVKGLSNTTWDDELATQVANSEELQGTAATQGQLQQAVSAVATEAAKQHTTVSGDDNLTVKSSVNKNGGTNYQVTLDDDITLGNPKAGNTEGERSFTINTTAPEGYVPDSYKEEGSSGANFIEENGGFMLFATDTQGHGIFGVTAKGSAWAKDFKTYTTDIYGNNTQYSLNEIGDAVAQMSSYYNEENGKSYTVFSRYLNEAEKDNPFATVDENATRDIPLALRDDGAVLIGATIKGDDFTDNGIRINGEIDDDGNNVATITGLENTTWTPPAPVATFAANDINTTSRAATEAQLNDLYNTVAAYDVNADGTVNYNHITLAGTPYNYGLSRSTDGTPTGGTSITNVAYASGTDGSEAVNVDYLKDTINKAVEAGGSISNSDKHLVANTAEGSNGVYKPNAEGNVNLIVSDEKGNSSTVTIGDVASKTELDSLKTNVGDLNYDKVTGDKLVNGDSVTTAIGKLDNKIDNISGTATNADNNTVTGGKINSDGTISLTQKDKDSIKLEGQLTDSGVVQEGTSFDKETGTITITSQDKYSGETSSVKVEGIASTEVVGATNKEDLATAYKDADKDGNATTEYITDSESMVEADVALDHAIQDVANTSYANDMVLSNRIDSVEKRLGNVEERIDKVGAMAAAIANLRTMGFDPEAPTEIAIGVGQYKSETGIAIGVFHYPNQDFMLSASLSSSGDELMGGIGATWKLGRKSAAERAKDEEARHLEQAEEMKKLAQQEKVKAQAQRHAKLLAERQQASQKNA